MKSIFFFFFSILTFVSFGQYSDGTNVGNLTLKFFKVDRIQAGGNTDLQLNQDFQYLQLFEKGQRFAPDEPSSFSSLEFTFLDKELRSKISWEQTIGIYRNHIKGDLILEDGQYWVHFGLGNSQVGVSSTGSLNYSFGKIKLGGFLQLGIGPNFSRFTSSGYSLKPKKWGYKGAGITTNSGVQLISPKFGDRFTIHGFINYNLSFSSYRNFTLSPTITRPVIPAFENIYFTTVSKKLSFSISLSYDILKKN